MADVEVDAEDDQLSLDGTDGGAVQIASSMADDLEVIQQLEALAIEKTQLAKLLHWVLVGLGLFVGSPYVGMVNSRVNSHRGIGP